LTGIFGDPVIYQPHGLKVSIGLIQYAACRGQVAGAVMRMQRDPLVCVIRDELARTDSGLQNAFDFPAFVSGIAINTCALRAWCPLRV